MYLTLGTLKIGCLELSVVYACNRFSYQKVNPGLSGTTRLILSMAGLDPGIGPFVSAWQSGRGRCRQDHQGLRRQDEATGQRAVHLLLRPN